MRCAPAPNIKRAAVFMLSVDCQDVIVGFTTTDFDGGAHTGDDDCETCSDNGWVNEEYEADCCRFDAIAMYAFEDSLSEILESPMFHKNAERCIESDLWTITATRTEAF